MQLPLLHFSRSSRMNRFTTTFNRGIREKSPMEVLYSNLMDCMIQDIQVKVTQPWFDINWQNPEGRTLLYIAARLGQNQCLSLLLTLPGIQIQLAAAPDGDTPLHISCFMGHALCAAQLLQIPGIGLNAKDKYGQTPLWQAVYMGQRRCVALLLAQPTIDIHIPDPLGQTALIRAWQHGNWSIIHQFAPFCIGLTYQLVWDTHPTCIKLWSTLPHELLALINNHF